MLKWLIRLSGTERMVATAISVVILVGGLACGLILKDKTGGIIIAWAAGIIGAFLIHPFLNSLLESKETVPEKTRVLKQELAKKDEEIARLKQKVPTLQEEITRLQGQRINVDGFRAVMELSLLRVDSVLRDFQHQRFDDAGQEIDPNGAVLNAGDYEYVGFMTKTFKANLGVDLAKVRVVEQAGRLVISGIETEFHGFRDMETTWPLREIRCQERSLTSPRKGELVVHVDRPGHPKTLLTLVEEQEKVFQQRLNQGTSYRDFDVAIEGMAKQFVEELLRPRGKKIVFEKSVPNQGQSLVEFVQAHNAGLECRIIDLEKEPIVGR